MHIDETMTLGEHLKVLEKIDEDFWVFHFDNKSKRNDFCKRVMKAITSEMYKITFIFILEGTELQNKRNTKMLKKIGENYEHLGIEHTIHGFVVPKSAYAELKEAFKGYITL